MEATKRFFKQAVDVVGYAPERVTTDGHHSYPRAIREALGSEMLHRTNRSLNNRPEQDHWGIKQRYYPMCDFPHILATFVKDIVAEPLVQKPVESKQALNECVG